MARTWLSIRVELISGHGRIFWPRPGRVFAAARSHTFGQLADAIDTAFARWDRAHLSQFQFADDGFIDSEDAVTVRLSALELGEKVPLRIRLRRQLDAPVHGGASADRP